MSRYALVGPVSNDLLTHEGRVIVHNDRAEMEWLFPNTRVVRISDGDIGPVLPLPDHPGLSQVRWPLSKEDFRR
jgi:hypothetical protein